MLQKGRLNYKLWTLGLTGLYQPRDSVGKTLRIRSKEFTLPSTAPVSRFGQPRSLRVLLVEI